MKFAEIVDIDELQRICESFTAMTGAVMAILDLEGNILVATGWKEICTHYHRVNPCTASRCQESDTILAGKLEAGEKYNVYRCKNGLIDVAVPILIDGEHVANFFTGQFLFEPPNIAAFSRQAEEFGFDKEAYLNALNQVSIFSEAQIEAMMAFFTNFAQLIGRIGLAQKKLEESNAQLLKAKNAAEAANRAKSIFIANMNHELRTPLNAILGFSELMARDETIRPKYRENLNIINHNGWHLFRIIEGVFDISRIDEGRLESNVHSFDLLKLVAHIYEIIKTCADRKCLNFNVEISPNVPQYIKTDNDKLGEILISLLDNAVKFTKQGQVVLRIDALPKNILEIEVIDSGVGISESNLEDLFKPFVQLARTNSGLEGMGLGLSTAKSLIELLGGKISVKSVLGEGSTFKIELPVALPNVDELKIEIPSKSVIEITSNQPTTELTADMLAVLSPELKQQLHHAALILDVDDLIIQIQQIAPDVAAGLQKLAQRYQFEKIIQLTAETPFGTAANNFCV